MNRLDAAGELAALILDKLDTLNEINKNTLSSWPPTNSGPIQRWIDDVRQKVITFNLEAITVPAHPMMARLGDA